MGIFSTRTEMDDKVIIVIKHPKVFVLVTVVCLIAFFIYKGVGLIADLAIMTFVVLAAFYAIVHFRAVWEVFSSAKIKGLRVQQSGSLFTFSDQIQYTIFK